MKRSERVIVREILTNLWTTPSSTSAHERGAVIFVVALVALLFIVAREESIASTHSRDAAQIGGKQALRSECTVKCGR